MHKKYTHNGKTIGVNLTAVAAMSEAQFVALMAKQKLFSTKELAEIHQLAVTDFAKL